MATVLLVTHYHGKHYDHIRRLEKILENWFDEVLRFDHFSLFGYEDAAPAIAGCAINCVIAPWDMEIRQPADAKSGDKHPLLPALDGRRHIQGLRHVNNGQLSGAYILVTTLQPLTSILASQVVDAGGTEVVNIALDPRQKQNPHMPVDAAAQVFERNVGKVLDRFYARRPPAARVFPPKAAQIYYG